VNSITIDRKVAIGAIVSGLLGFGAWIASQCGLPVPPTEVSMGLQTAIVLLVQWQVRNVTAEK